MSIDQRALNVTVVSADTKVLHEVSWVLEAVGYEVQATKDFGPDALWRRYAVADFIIFDGRNVPEPYGPALTCDSDNPVYRIFLYDPSPETGFSAWFSAGANDALRVPISRGELLARIRTGARFLEFERRFKRQSSKQSLPGTYSKSEFLRKLRKYSASSEINSSSHTLTFISIDWYEGIRYRSGRSAARHLVAEAASAIRRSAGENAISAYWGNGCFATFQIGPSIDAARAAAENLAKEFASRESQQETIAWPTLSIAVMPWLVGESPDKVVISALETLALAKQSGGDRVIEHGEYSGEFAAWQQEMATGDPFANVVAQDIMESFPATLLCDTDQSEMVAALRRSGVPVCPYVDASGRLVGVASAETPGDDAPADEPRPAAALPITEPETVAHNATFPEIYEAFSTRGCSTLVVVAGDEPLGYLTCEGFLSMIEPIDAATFSSTEEPGDSTRYLVVTSATGEPEPACA